jgi:hypothetical protein
MNPTFEKKVLINANPATVWKALTEPAQMVQWMGEPEMGLTIETTWQVNSLITISGFHHIKFENKGAVLIYDPHRTLSYTHLSSVSRLADKPEHYSIFIFILTPVAEQTELALAIENFPTEVIYQHLCFYWRTTVEKIRLFVEKL